MQTHQTGAAEATAAVTLITATMANKINESRHSEMRIEFIITVADDRDKTAVNFIFSVYYAADEKPIGDYAKVCARAAFGKQNWRHRQKWKRRR